MSASALLLTGCGVATPAVTVTVTATPTPSGTAAALTGSPVGTTCDDLVPATVMQSLYPGYTLDSSHVADASEWNEITSMGGVVCAWGGNDNKGDIVIGYGHPDTPSLTTIEGRISNDKTYAVADDLASPPDGIGYFGKLGGVPDAEVFLGGYWVTISSNLFGSANDAKSLLDSVNQVIPQA